ncbi:bifunctional diaminohydroxyphosphoribosylaminopyrimidine deaminase/5-amino-6-(5-phosphoribosylamino)uracil reductase RibD [Oxalobacter formigenes]|uniref:bifunctional diaminohydroxyphosphoribosylaminopyrimidine deaminase/5-amino-6-(5-phosphoribosylamino)uracil reductase RibD n=1 Tax=Oxalobacter formigenes TaxID=847 RepID=UPI00241E5BB1|nr:bifunctional diaminohydroxyphosphoribosylaminopyrimidine deaminase/5-amino-6-(5-phosphoribosylamino)uracil reductase RibD [Oxalobacter formigenes]
MGELKKANDSLADHEKFMRRALELARKCSVLTSPNPRVGCVIVRDGEIIGEGFTQPVGGNHAEVEALNDVAKRGQDCRGATVYVTLEPCSHQGRTPPCADALIRANVKRVVAAIEDPNVQVAGKGLAKLKAAGIEVLCGVLPDEARELNRGFLSRFEHGRPWVRMKVAASLDGKTALTNGESQWITSEAARRDGHEWRMRADAIMTGIGTVIKDNPRLNVRLPDTIRQPKRIVVDSQLKTPIDARVLENGGDTWIFSANASPYKIEAMQEKGVQVFSAINDTGRVDLADMMKVLAEKEINEVHVEAGATLNGALIQAGFVDEMLIYLAPCFLGSGKNMVSLNDIANLADKISFEFHEIRTIENDIRIIARLTK